MRVLTTSDISKHPSYDLQGYVFTYEDRLYRAIYPSYEANVMRLFDSGLIDELVQEGLFPRSQIAPYRTSDCNLVIEHERIPVVTLPFEWSFSMLQDAARAIVKTNIISRKHGYQTRDAHGFNVLFQYGKPLFVDLGSFVEIQHDFRSPNPGWWSYGEFMRFFYAPLWIWSRGDSFIARHALHGDQMPMTVFWRHKNFLMRLLPSSLLEKVEFIYYKYKGLNTKSLEDFLEFASRDQMRERVARWILWYARRRPLPFSSVNLDRTYERVDRIRRGGVRSKWGDYQSKMQVSERHRHIVGWLERLDVKTVLDLGGNAGLLARLILSSTDVEYVISADYDEEAVDTLYRSLRESPAKIFPVLLNFGIAVADTKLKTAQERYRSEAVLALALTHHLLLSQGMTIEFIFERLKSFSSKYVFVEFMPMGCYSSQKGKIPYIPEWYTLEWFRSRFKEHFTLLDESLIAENRILFIGQIGDEVSSAEELIADNGASIDRG